MAISEEAQRNHDALFPGHVSTLKVTDPELIEIFDNWAFGEVLEDGVLDSRTRCTRTRPGTSSTSSGSCPRTASATTTLATAWT